jgi:hypothetical protein
LQKRKLIEAWVVYKMRMAGELGPNAVREQPAWDGMARVEPGRDKLIQGGVASETEAVRLAGEGSPGGTPKGATLPAR